MNQIFNFNNNEISVIVNDNNDVMFLAKDICGILGISNVSQALSGLDDDEKNTIISNDGNKGNPITLIINESGLYSLVLSSKKPDAKIFKKWVTSEVLPSVRKHGMYANKQTIDEMLTSPDFAIKTLEALKKERAEKELLQIQNQNQKQALQLSAPKVGYHSEVLTSNSTYTTTLIAKELGVSAMDLNRKINDLKIQYKQNEVWVLYSKYHNQGYTKTTTATYTNSQGITKTSMLTVWTEKGRLFIHELIKQLKSA